MKFKELLHYYILAFFLLLGYYLADFLGITDFVFPKSTFVILSVLTLYYGTIILIVDSILHKILLKE